MLDRKEGVSGEQGGELLASYILLKKDDFPPIGQFGGPIKFLEAQLGHYKSLDPPGSTSIEQSVCMHAVKFANSVVTALAAKRATPRAPLFTSPGAATSRAPLFSAPVPKPMSSAPKLTPMSSARYTEAMPPRCSASTPRSREDGRLGAMRLMQTTKAMAGVQQAQAEAAQVNLVDVHRSDKVRGDRGRTFSLSHVAQNLEVVTAKLRTAKLRTNFHSDAAVLVDDDAGDDDVDESGGDEGEEEEERKRSDVRVRVRRVIDTSRLGLPEGEDGWEWDMPAVGKKLIKQRVAALYLNDEGEPAWFEGIVLDVMERKYNHGTSDLYHIFFAEDNFDDMYTLPDNTIAYKVGHMAGREEMGLAKAIMSK